MPKHPMQPIELDEHGTARFKGNTVVQYLLDAGGIDMNKLAIIPFDQDDRQHFAQLIGYSVCGFGDLSYTPRKIVEEADAQVEELLAKKKRKKK